MHSLLQVFSRFLKQIAIGFHLVLPLLHIPAKTGMKKRLQGTAPAPSCLKRAIQGGASFIVSAGPDACQAAFGRRLAGQDGTGNCPIRYPNRSAGLLPKKRSAAVVPSPRLSQ
jgi:hypothetical protein